jgi:hypothetical protein
MQIIFGHFPYLVKKDRLTNTKAATEELLEALFSVRSMQYETKIGDNLFPEFLFNILFAYCHFKVLI